MYQPAWVLVLRLPIALLLGMGISLSGCGDDTDFSGGTAIQAQQDLEAKGDPNAPPPDGTDVTDPAPYDALYWFWECDSQPSEQRPEASSENELVLEGEGDHSLDERRIHDTPLTISGKMCPPQDLSRDIVFIIDVSGSMGNNDPATGGTCGRLQAVETVLADLGPQSDANIGLVTFSDDVVATSGRLFPNKASLFQGVAGSGAIANALCGVTLGTDYRAALNGATQVLRAGRENATKEIYLISDGEPNPTEEGRLEAEVLKTVGVEINGTYRPVTIATVMLSGNDQVLEKDIASRNADGIPLHAFVAQAGQLSEVLANLADNEIVGGLMKYRPVGSQDWTAIDLTDHLDGNDFIMPEITLEVASAPDGLELVYEYFDKHDNRFTSGGTLTWTATSSPGEDPGQ